MGSSDEVSNTQLMMTIHSQHEEGQLDRQMQSNFVVISIFVPRNSHAFDVNVDRSFLIQQQSNAGRRDCWLCIYPSIDNQLSNRLAERLRVQVHTNRRKLDK